MLNFVRTVTFVGCIKFMLNSVKIQIAFKHDGSCDTVIVSLNCKITSHVTFNKCKLYKKNIKKYFH
jgi:hypothetical protein